MPTLPARQLIPLLCEAIEQGGSFRLTVTGISMAPTLKPGRDSVELVRGTPCKGDIVFFRRASGEYILHRVIKTGDTLTVNGDNQRWTEQIRPSQVIAVARSICRGGKHISCRSPLYRVYSGLWMGLRPLRGLIAQLGKKQ